MTVASIEVSETEQSKGENMDQVVKDDKDMSEAIERLRVSKTEENNLGVEDGKAWAKQTASYKELETISSLDLCDEDADDLASFVDARLGNNDPYFLFCEEDGTVASDAYVEGFVDGAREVWRQVRHKI